MFFLWICPFIPNVPHSFQPMFSVNQISSNPMEFYENLIDFYRFQAISKILWFRGRLLRGETRKDLTRSIWPWGWVINPLLTLEVIFPRIKSPGHKNYVWILLVSWPYTPLPSSHRASSCFAMRALRSLFGRVDLWAQFWSTSPRQFCRLQHLCYQFAWNLFRELGERLKIRFCRCLISRPMAMVNLKQPAEHAGLQARAWICIFFMCI